MSSAPTPLTGVDLVLADLDGVVYQGAAAIESAVSALSRVKQEGRRVGYVTNNASRTDEQIAEHLRSLGLTVLPSEIVTSPQAAVRVLAELVDQEALVFVVGGSGLVTEVEKAGFRVTRRAADHPAAVVQGFSPDLGWKELAEASFALHHGIPWVATNTDWTIPVEGGIAPGNGTLVSAVHTAVGRLPVVAGKPEKAIFEEAVRRFGARSPIFVGDRLDTDTAGALRSGMQAVHVLTGVDGPKQLLAAPVECRPHFILNDLRGLFEPYPPAQIATDFSWASVGDSRVVLRADSLEVQTRGESALNRLRAACALIWASSRSIYGLTVAPELYS